MKRTVRLVLALIVLTLCCVMALTSCDALVQLLPGFGGTTDSEHECESVCSDCGRCTDKDCTEGACADKCEGHETIIPPHGCNNVCPECAKCTNEYCKEDVCKDKCAGHVPPHACEHVCPECGKCTNEYCEEDVCKDKCAGHVPPHACEHVCPECGKCTDDSCTEDACRGKCAGHEVAFNNNVAINVSDLPVGNTTAGAELAVGTGISTTSSLVIEANGKAIDCWSFTLRLKLGGTMKASGDSVTAGVKIVTNDAATIVVYAISGSSTTARALRLATLNDGALTTVAEQSNVVGDAIGKYEFAVSEAGTYYLGSANSGINLYYIAVVYTAEDHVCHNICSECGKCLDAVCAEDICQDKCAGHHVCENACPECGKCLNANCAEDVCQDKCTEHEIVVPPHTCEHVCPDCGKCTDASCAESACIDKCAGHTVTPPAHACEHVCPDCGKCTDASCAESACENKCQGHEAPVNGSVVNISNLTITSTTAGVELVEGTGISASGGLTIDGNKKEIDGFSFTLRLKLGGTMKVSSGKVEAGVQIVTKGAATIVVYAISSSSTATRTLRLATLEGGSLVSVVENGNVAGDAIGKFEFEVASAGTYYLGSKSSGINLYYIAVVYAEETHTCEHVCSECGKCTDTACAESACTDKCAGHTVTPPTHTCDHVCPECGKCTDNSCTESACTDKCAGHTVTPPAHTCEHVCPECGKCTDNSCTESACTDKCAGHTVTPPAHTCDHVCPECGKCTDTACAESDCTDKCAGHSIEITGSIDVTLAEAGLESIYFEWLPIDDVDGYKVYCDTILVDNELIRFYGDHYRCDIVGIRAELHFVKVVPVKDGKELENVATEFSATAEAHVREGFAFVGNGDANGAYNADGTLKAGAVVLYVTNENKDTISLTMKTESKKTETKVGVQNILLGLKKGFYEHPLCIRFIGNITDPATLDKGDLIVDINNGAYTKGLTLEGIGNDTTFNGFGLRLKGAKNVEVRNIGFMNCNSNEGDNLSLQQDNAHIWIHNCDFFYGDAGSDADQAKGDGALDVKVSTNVTISFNHYYDSGKCNLQGMKSESTENCITYHHNWYDHSDSRHPRVRTCTIHAYNNFYDGIAKYGIGATSGCSIFSEANYFLNTSRPMMISKQGTDALGDGTFSGEPGGIIKSYGDVMVFTDNSVKSNFSFISYSQNKTSFDAYVASSRNETVPGSVVALSGGTSYSNFDTSSGMYSYNVQTAEDARDTVVKYAGRVQGGDFKWTFTDKDNSDYNVNSALKSALQNYKSSLVSVGGLAITTPDSGNTNPEGGNTNPEGGNTNPEGGNTNPEGGNTTPDITGGIVHDFTASGKTSQYFTINGNLSTSKGTVEYAGKTLTQCLKMESSTSITFTMASAGKVTLVFNPNGSCKIDGEKYTSSNNAITVELGEGQHTITKADSINLFYIVVELNDAE